MMKKVLWIVVVILLATLVFAYPRFTGFVIKPTGHVILGACTGQQTQCAGKWAMQTCGENRWSVPEPCDFGNSCFAGFCEEITPLSASEKKRIAESSLDNSYARLNKHLSGLGLNGYAIFVMPRSVRVQISSILEGELHEILLAIAVAYPRTITVGIDATTQSFTVSTESILLYGNDQLTKDDVDVVIK